MRDLKMEKVILFSGGYDSTYLLNQIMQEEKSVTVVSIRSNTLPKNKILRELIQVLLITLISNHYSSLPLQITYNTSCSFCYLI